MDEEIYQDAILSAAAYVDYGSYEGELGGRFNDQLINGGLTERQVHELDAKYAIVKQYNEPSGLSATIFENKETGEKHVAFRGTEPNDIADLFQDMLLTYGYVYSIDGNGELSLGQANLTDVPDFLFKLGIVDDTGEYIPSSEKFIHVTGHSLGGHLALMMGMFYPDVISSINTFNGAGIALTDLFAEAVFENVLPLSVLNGIEDRINNYYGQAGSEVTANNWWFYRPGGREAIWIEDHRNTGELVDFNFPTHGIKHLVQSLSVYRLFSKLDPSFNSESGLEKLFTIFEAMANDAGTQVLETLTRHIGNLFAVDSAVVDPAELYELLDNRQTTINSLADLDADNIASFAKLDNEIGLAYRYALENNLSFAVHSGHEITDQSLNRDNFTDQYLLDRALFIENLLHRNLENAASPASNRYAHFVDRNNAISFYTDEGFPQFGDRQQYIFDNDQGHFTAGQDGNDRLYGQGGNDTLLGQAGNDYIEGGNGDDHIYGGSGNDDLLGGAGNDTLSAGEGADILLGGAGIDSYEFDLSGIVGHNIIDDEDGDGILSIVGGDDPAGLISPFDVDSDGYGYYRQVDANGSAINQWIYVVSASGLTLLDEKNPQNSLLINNWQEGAFGIAFVSSQTNDTPQPAGDNTELFLVDSDVMFDYGTARAAGYQHRIDALSVGFAYHHVPNWHGIEYEGREEGTNTHTARDYIYDLYGQGLLYEASDFYADCFNYFDGFHYYEVESLGEFEFGEPVHYMDWYEGFSSSGYGFVGSPLADELNGSVYRDLLIGAPGNDILRGDGISDGTVGDRDYLVGDPGSDQVFGGGGDDIIFGFNSHNLFHSDENETVLLLNHGQEWNENQAAYDWLWGQGGNDIIVGSNATDFAFGGEGDDVIAGGENADLLIGGQANDILLGDSSLLHYSWTFIDGNRQSAGDAGGAGPGIPLIQGEPDFSQSRWSIIRYYEYIFANDNETSERYDDQLEGGAGFDTLYGEIGDDQLFGGADDDILYGDRYTVDAAPLEIDGFAAGRYLPTEIAGLSLEFHGNDRLYGGGGKDTLIGNGGNDELYGGDDNDLLYGDDHYLAAYLTETERSAGCDTLDGGEGNDVLYGQGGADQLLGGGGDDLLDGGSGDDSIFGGDGADIIYAGSGDDFVEGGAADDLIIGQAGEDTLRGGAGSDILYGDAQAADDSAGSASDVLIGGIGNDELYGGEGNDFLDGGDGQDYLAGQGGDDLYFISRASGADTLVDLQGNNTLVLRGIYRDELDISGSAGQYQFSWGSQENRLTLSAQAENLLLQLSDETLSLADFLNRQSEPDSLPESGGVLYGSQYHDTLSGSVSSDTLLGLNGDDTLHQVVGGSDTLMGGKGNDTYVLADGNADVLILEKSWEGDCDTVQLTGGGDYQLAEHIEHLSITGTANTDAARATGNTLNNRIRGMSSFANVLDGAQGADTLIGGSADDVYIVDSTDDVVIEIADGGYDEVHASVDYHLGDHQEALLLGGEIARQGRGNALDNTLDSHAASAVATLTGGQGNDTYIIKAGDRVIELAGEGNDTLIIEAGNVSGEFSVDDYVAIENLSIETTGELQLNGSDTDNVLSSSAVQTTFQGGLGNDLLLARGAGNDSYLFSPGDGHDRIVDDGGIDSIHFAAGISSTELYFTIRGDDLLISFHGDNANSLTIANWEKSASRIETLVFANEADWENFDGGDYNHAPLISAVNSDGNNSENSSYEYFIAPDSAQALLISAAEFLSRHVSDADNDNLSIVSVSASNGTAVYDTVDQSISYLPEANFHGEVALVVEVSDGASVSSGEINVYVNSLPEVSDIQANTDENRPLVFSLSELMAAASDVDGDMLQLAFVGNAAQGSVRHEGEQIVFTPQADYFGAASFEFAVSDGVQTGSGRVAINVLNVNQAPEQEASLELSTSEDVVLAIDIASLLALFSDREGDALEFSGFRQPEDGGYIEWDQGNGQLIYTPNGNFNGAADFTWYLADADNEVAVKQSIYVQPLHDEFSVGDMQLVMDGQESMLTVDVQDLLDRALYGDSQELKFAGIDADSEANATLAYNEVTGLVSISPNSGFKGDLNIPFSISDGEITKTGTLTVAVTDSIIAGTFNSETLAGTDGNDLISGHFGSDILYGHDGNDQLSGGDGNYNNNVLYGGNGADLLYANGGNNILYGEHGDDQLVGGSGNDKMHGGEGADTLIVGRGNGDDRIENFQQNDKLLLVDAIEPADVWISRKGNGLLLKLPAGGSVLISDYFAQTRTDNPGLIVFQNGEVWDANYCYNASIRFSGNSDTVSASDGIDILDGQQGNDRIHGGLGRDTLYGAQGNDLLYGDEGQDKLFGGEGNDVLHGGADDDVLDGGQGRDRLIGGSGNDTYIYRAGDGNTRIFDLHPDDKDTLRLGEGISLDNVVFIREQNNLLIDIDAGQTGDLIEIEQYFGENNTPATGLCIVVNESSAADEYISLDYTSIRARTGRGTSANDWLYGDLYQDDTIAGLDGDDRIFAMGANNLLEGGAGSDQIWGAGGDDTLDGGSGDDLLSGGGGNNTYRFGYGDGNDRIQLNSGGQNENSIVVEFKDAIAVADVVFRQLDHSLYITLLATGETLNIIDFFHTRQSGTAFSLRFDDLHIDDPTTLRSQFSMSENSDYFSGAEGPDLVNGLGGDDTLRGRDGDDTLYAGDGDDSLYGDNGADLLYGGEGNDSIYGQAGNDEITGGAGDDFLRGGLGFDGFYFAKGDGSDQLRTDGEGGFIEYTDDTSIADLGFTRSGSQLAITISDSPGDQITLPVFFSTSYKPLEWIKTADGYLYYEQILAKLLATTEGDDDVAGFGGNDVIDGLAGNDTINSYGGDDVVWGGFGNDYIHVGDGSDSAYGNAGNDTLYAGDGNNHLSGGSGNDVLNTGYGMNTLYGDDGDDELWIRYGGENKLTGGEGADRYYQRGNGSYSIIDNYDSDGSFDSLHYSSRLENVRLYQIAEDLLLESSSTVLRIEKQFSGDNYRIEQVQFDDVSLDYQQISEAVSYFDEMMSGKDGADDVLAGSAGSDLLNGYSGNDEIEGFAGADYLQGGSGDDTLEGGAGDDSLFGGLGNDLLIGGAGKDRYLHRSGDGNDQIITAGGADSSEMDILHLQNIDKNTVYLTKNADELHISYATTTITVSDYFTVSSPDNAPGNEQINGLAAIEFDDGSSRSYNYVSTLLGGNNSAPIVTDNSFTFDEDSPVSIAIADLLADDFDADGHDIQLVSLANIDQSSYRLSGDTIFIETQNNFNGLIEFDYTISDGNAAATGQVRIEVLPVNDAPITAADQFDLLEGEQCIITRSELLLNDYDIDNDALTITAVSEQGESVGDLLFDSDSQTISYTPNAGYIGSATLRYEVSDGSATTSEEINVNVDLLQANGEQRVANTAGIVNISFDDLLANEVNVDGAPFYFEGISAAVHGSASINHLDRMISFIADSGFSGLAGFDYVVSTHGYTRSATVSVEVPQRILPPVAVDETLRVDLNTTTAIAASDLLANDSGGNGNAISFVGINQSTGGNASYDPVSGLIIFTPQENYTGLAEINYQLQSIAGIANATLRIAVTEAMTGSSVLLGQSDSSSERIYAIAGVDNTIDGGAGVDRIHDRAGNDTLYGGTGDDIFYMNSGSNIAYGEMGEDVFYGSSGDNTLYGGAGNDWLKGDSQRQGSNTLIGGSGDDEYHYYSSKDIIIEHANEGEDTLFARSNNGLILPDGVENLVVENNNNAYVSAHHYYGNALDNVMTGEAGRHTALNGGEGNDTLIGRSSQDYFYVDSLGDVVVLDDNYLASKGRIYSSVDGYAISNNAAELWLSGDSAIRGYGDGYNNVLNSTLSAAVNTLYGGGGDDIYQLKEGDVAIELDKNGGTDHVVLDHYNPTLPDGINRGYYSLADKPFIENLSVLYLNIDAFYQGATLIGNDLDNIITGASKNDTLQGGAGDDFLVGNNGVYQNGGGNDTYVFNLGDGNDWIFDKALSAGSLFDTIAFGEGIVLADLSAELSADGHDFKLNYSANDSVTILNWNNENNRIEILLFDDGIEILDFDENSFAQSHNKIPTTTGITTQYLQEDFSDYTINLQELFSDAETASENLQFTVNANTHINVDITDGIANISNALLNWHGQERLVFTATDEAGLSVDAQADFVVAAVNDLPTCIGLETQNLSKNFDNYSIDLKAIFDDVETSDDKLLFTVSGNNRIGVMLEDGIASITNSVENWSGTENIIFTAMDENGASIETGADFIVEPADDDVFRGDGAANIFNGGPGNDSLYGYGGNDQLIGGEGNDYLDGGARHDVLSGDAGNDYLAGRGGRDTLFGGADNDRLYGHGGADTLSGEAGNDSLYGGGGNDLLFGGAGKDILKGGAGNDTYVFELGDGRDVIRDRDARGQDQVLFGKGITPENLWFSQYRNHLLVDVVGTQDRIKFNNWFKDEKHAVNELHADGHVLSNDRVDQLVAAMSAFAVPAGAGTVISGELKNQLEPVLSSTWQSAAY